MVARFPLLNRYVKTDVIARLQAMIDGDESLSLMDVGQRLIAGESTLQLGAQAPVDHMEPIAADEEDQPIIPVIKALVTLNRLGNSSVGAIETTGDQVRALITGLPSPIRRWFFALVVPDGGGRKVEDMWNLANSEKAWSFCHKAFSSALLKALKAVANTSAMSDAIPTMIYNA